MSPRLFAGLSAAFLLSLGTVVFLHGQSDARPPQATVPEAVPAAADAAPATRRRTAAAGETTTAPAEAREGTAEPVPGQSLGADRHAVRVEDFSGLLDAYDSLSTRELSAFRDRYDGAIDFGSPDEFDWLASNGYPLPEEILDAAGMSLQELEAMAATGDEKAEFLYFDRLNQEVLKARERHVASGLTPETLTENREFLWVFVEADKYRSRIADNASPFAGYVLAHFYETALQNPYAAAGALYLTGTRGDHVALLAAERILGDYGIGEEARLALASYSLVVRERDPVYYQPDPRPGP